MTAPAELPRRLRLIDAVSIVVGSMIGAGIFLVPNLVARQISSPDWILTAWILGGVLSFFGALAHAELAAMLPATGGPYAYLRESFGPMTAFLSGWMYLLVFTTGSIAWLAVSFSVYLEQFIALSRIESMLISVALLAVLGGANYAGVRIGAGVQKTFTALKISGLAALVLASFASPARAVAPESAAAFDVTRFGVAMIACLLTYDGWVTISFVAGEVERPQRNVPLALGGGLAIVTVVYVVANAAYLRVLSPSEIAATERVGTLVAERTLGPAGAALVGITILCSTFGCANGWMLTAPRIFYAQARDGLFFARFGELHPRFLTPANAIVMQAGWAAFLVATGAYAAFATFVMFAAWIFYGLTVAGLIVLRRRDPDRPRPYRMWGYPFTPVAFIFVAFGFVVNTLVADPVPALSGLALIAAGAPAYWLWRKRSGESR